MTIVLLRKVLLYVMMGLAFLGVQLSKELSPIVIGLFWSGLAVSWFWEAPRIRFERWAPFWTWLTVAVFGFTIVDVALLGEFYLISAMNFVLFLATAKLFQLAEDKDVTQAMALSLMLLAAGAVLNDNVSYGVMFGLYTVTATLALTTQHVAVETRTHHRERMRSMRMERSILYSTLVLGLLVFAGSTVFFFTFPRIGVGAFMSQSRRGVSSSGFGDNVELGSHGRIRDDATVAMRVVFPNGPPMPVPEIHWRGISLDFYDGRSWRDTDDRQRDVLQFPDQQGYGVGGGRGSGSWEDLTRDAVQVEINLEPLEDSDILFTIGRWRALSLPNTIGEVPGSAFGRALRADETGAVELRTRNALGKRYLSYSELNLPDPAVLRDAAWWDGYPDLGAALRASYVNARKAEEVVDPASIELTPEVIEAALEAEPASQLRGRGRADAARYLQLPPDAITPRMRELTASIRANAPGQYDFVVALESWLREELAYTTDLPEPDPGANLLDSFLFEWQRGHCEYFASAMVILLREQGIPARIVNGFLGADYNEVGRYYAVRQANAHSWVEVYFPRHGWFQFDPTPAGAAEMGPQGFFRRWSLMVDSLRLAWFRWVVEYDIEKQFSVLRDVASQLRGSDDNGQFTMDAAESARRAAFWLWRNYEALGLLFLLHIGGIVFFQRRGARRIPLDGVDRVAAVAWAGCGLLVVQFGWSSRSNPVIGYAIAVIPPAVAYVLARLLRGPQGTAPQRGRQSVEHAVSALWIRLLRGIERAGIDVPISLTAKELDALLRELPPELRTRVAEFAAFYERARFSGEANDPAVLRRWRREVNALARAIRAAVRAMERSRRRGG